MRKVAVVDDNADNRLIIRTILEDQYDIVEFASGLDAIAGFRKDKPDVVILDISLPEMDGTEILRRLRDDAQLHDLPVIALTAHAMVGDREKYLAAGFKDYVSKPSANVLTTCIFSISGSVVAMVWSYSRKRWNLDVKRRSSS